MKPEDVTGRAQEVFHGMLLEQRVNQMEGILLSWKLKNYGILWQTLSGRSREINLFLMKMFIIFVQK